MTVTKPAENPEAPALSAQPAKQGWLRRFFRAVPWGIVGPILSLALFAGALYVLGNILTEVEPEDVVAAFTATPASALALSIGFTFLSYLSLTGYDGLALRQIGARDVPYATAAIGSFTSYAISYTLGFPLLTAGTVRYRVYGAAGLTAPQIAALTLVCTLTFWLGMATVLAVGLILVPDAVAQVDHLPTSMNVVIGVLLLVLVLAYVVFVATKRRVVTVEGWSMPLPGGKVTVAQIALGVFDVCMGAAALYVLLPPGATVDYWTFTVIYVLAAILGVVSHAPGGIGVFEASMMIALPSIPRDELLGTLLLFRVVYYFIPFALALVILGAYEIARRRHVLARAVDLAADIMKPIAPILLGGGVFVAGSALLITSALPIGEARRAILVDFVPLGIVEAAHLAVAILGVALLFLARGLIRRLRSAWIVAGIVLGLSAVLVLLRSADWRQAAVILVLLLVLVLGRPAFGRLAPLISARFSLWWIVAVATVLGASLWVGSFAHRAIALTPELWTTFALDADKPRFLRGLAAATLAAGLIVLASLALRRRIRQPGQTTRPELDRLVANDPRPESRLALLSDKTIITTPGHDAALATAARGKSLIALGDPIGDRGRDLDLIWALRERAEQAKRHPVILAASPGLRPLCLDAGLSLTPLGDVAIVDLDRPVREPLADGFSLALAAPGSDPAPLLALARLWRDNRRAGSGGFVVGPETTGWLSRNVCAVLRWNGGVAGFAVILQGGGGEAWALDRTVLDPSLVETLGADTVLGALVVALAASARSFGARALSLGLTPVPAAEGDPIGPAWSRLSPSLFTFGEILPDQAAQRAFKARFATRFEPRYLACPGGWALPEILLDITALIEAGPD